MGSVAVVNEDHKDLCIKIDSSPRVQIYCTTNDNDDFFQSDLKESQKNNNSIDCIEPNCSGVDTCETVANAAKNRKSAYLLCRKNKMFSGKESRKKKKSNSKANTKFNGRRKHE